MPPRVGSDGNGGGNGGGDEFRKKLREVVAKAREEGCLFARKFGVTTNSSGNGSGTRGGGGGGSILTAVEWTDIIASSSKMITQVTNVKRNRTYQQPQQQKGKRQRKG